MMKNLWINVGCGDRLLPGFVNIDKSRKGNLRCDVTKGLPYKNDSVDLVYSEHFLEHLSQSQGLAFLRECRRVLRPGGVLRIAMPDLDSLVDRYMSDDWRGDGDMFKFGYDWVTNRCEMLNLSMREWGHQWVYNEEELTYEAMFAGLSVRGRMKWGESDHPALNGLEYRTGSKLIMEFSKQEKIAASEKPLVSLLMPAYKSQFFYPALQSALAQTYRNLEIIVCDDCPDDSVNNIVQDLGGRDERLRYERNANRHGPLDNYLKCLNLARGEFIKYLNDDDVLDPKCVERMVNVFVMHPDVTLVTCRRGAIGIKGENIPVTAGAKPIVQQDSVFEGTGLARALLSMETNTIGEPSAAMFRKGNALFIRPHMLSFGGYAAPGWGDLSLWLNLLSQGNAAYLVESLCHIRIHPAQSQRDPELVARRRAANPLRRLRLQATRLGLYRYTRGFPDPVGVIIRIRYQFLKDRRKWRRKFQNFYAIFAFSRAFVGAFLWSVRHAWAIHRSRSENRRCS